MFIELLENNVTNWNSQPYCNLCKTKHSSLEDAFHHIAKEKHKVAKSKRDTELLTELGINSEEDWLLLVRNNIAVNELNRARCVPCHKYLQSLNTVFTHICTKQHKKQLNNQNEKLSTVKRKEKTESDICKIEDVYQDVALPPKRFKIDDTYRDDKINIKIQRKGTSNPSEKYKNYDAITFNNSVHKYSEAQCRLFINNGVTITSRFELVCNICQYRFLRVTASVVHFCGEALKSKAALELKAESKDKSKNVKPIKIKHSILVDNKIAMFGPTHCICIPCKMMFFSGRDTLKHINKKKHTNALKVNKRDKNSTYSATITELNNYSEKIRQEFVDNRIKIDLCSFHCLFCEQCLPDLKNVLLHIKGKSHTMEKHNKNADTTEKKGIKYVETVNLQINADKEKSEIQNAHQNTETENINNYSEEECQMLVDNKIAILGPTCLMCVVCEQVFSSLRIILVHISGKCHINTLEHQDAEQCVSESTDENHDGYVKSNLRGQVEKLDLYNRKNSHQDRTITLAQETSIHQVYNANDNEKHENRTYVTAIAKLNDYSKKKRQQVLDNKLVIFERGRTRCVPCGRYFEHLKDAFQHIKGKSHNSMLKRHNKNADTTERKDIKHTATVNLEIIAEKHNSEIKHTHEAIKTENFNNYSGKQCQILVANKIAILGPNCLMCVACERLFPSLRITLRHIKEKYHINALLTYMLMQEQDAEQCIGESTDEKYDEYVKLNLDAEKKLDSSNRKDSYQDRTVTLPQTTSIHQGHNVNNKEEYKSGTYSEAITKLNNYSEKKRQEFENNGIKILGPDRFSCALCGWCSSKLRSVLRHIKGKHHDKCHNKNTDSTEKKDLNHNEIADSQINVMKERPEIQHAHEDTNTENLNNYSEEECQILVDNKIAILGPTYLLCVVCEQVFSSLRIILVHINGKCHVNALEHQDAEQFVSESTDENHDGYVNGKNSRQDRTTTLAQETSIHQEYNVNDNEKHENRTCVTAVTNLKDYSEKKRQEFVDNKIEIIGPRCFRCLLCKRIYRSLKSFSDHIKGKHNDVAKCHNKNTDSTEKKDLNHNETVDSQINVMEEKSEIQNAHQDTETKNLNNHSEKECQILADNKIEIIGPRCFYCMVCKGYLQSLKSVSVHIKGKHHIDVAKYHEKKIDATKKKNISQVASVNLHINAEKGVSKLKHKNQETTVTMPKGTMLDSFSADECQNGTGTKTCQQPSLDNSTWNDKRNSETFADGAHKTEHFNS